jgi:hypothetical protein
VILVMAKYLIKNLGHMIFDMQLLTNTSFVELQVNFLFKFEKKNKGRHTQQAKLGPPL